MGNVSTPNPFLLAAQQGPDPKDIALIEKIIEKTFANKIYWNRTKSGYTAQYPQLGLSLEFAGSTAGSWSNFSVKTKEGTVLTVENRQNLVFAILAGMSVDPLAQSVEKLFALVEKVGEGKVERAIKLIDAL